MTTTKTTEFRLPDPPEREPDEMTSFDHIARAGGAYLLAQHLGNPDTTLIAGERYIALVPTRDMTGVKYPDLLVAFDVDPEAYSSSNAYIISEQGKPPDFVLEIASRGTWREDVGEKREAYAALSIPEYWRFDETGEYYGDRLIGERLVADEYRPIPIEQLAEDLVQGRSDVLGLDIRWHGGRLEWYDPETGRHIATFDDERARADNERARADGEREARLRAEARTRELEEELRRLRGE